MFRAGTILLSAIPFRTQ